MIGTFPPTKLELKSDQKLVDIFKNESIILLAIKAKVNPDRPERPERLDLSAHKDKTEKPGVHPLLPSASQDHQKSTRKTSNAATIDFVPHMIVEKMPQDNSCLFHAIGYILLSLRSFFISVDCIRFVLLNQEIGIADKLRSSTISPR